MSHEYAKIYFLRCLSDLDGNMELGSFSSPLPQMLVHDATPERGGA